MDRPQLESRLRDECPAIAEQAIELVLPCARFVTGRSSDDDIPVAASKFGGNPDLPAGFEWPCSTDNRGRQHLNFLAQIDLAELAAYDIHKTLPKAGHLSFFYDAEGMPGSHDEGDTSGWRVFHFSPSADLQRTTVRGDPLKACRVTIHFGWSLPSVWTFVNDSTDLSDDESEAYFEIVSRLNVGAGQFLGHADPIQCAIEAEAAHDSGDIRRTGTPGLKSVQEEQARRWRLLFQLYSDDQLDVMWGDVGTIYYAIRRQDLDALNFNETMLIFQCS